MGFIGLVRLLALVLVIWLLLRFLRSRALPQKPPELDQPEMQACEHCQTHVPETQAIEGKNGWYCSEEHRAEAES